MPYFIISNKTDTHNGLKLTTGLNVFKGDIHQDKKKGFTFSNEKNIFNYFFKGFYVREVSIATDFSGLKMVEAHGEFRSNAVILGKRRLLSRVSTYDFLKSLGIVNIENLYLSYSVFDGVLSIFKHLTSELQIDMEKTLDTLSRIGNLDLVKFIVKRAGSETGFAPWNIYDCIRSAIEGNHIDVVMYLFDHARQDLLLGSNEGFKSRAKNVGPLFFDLVEDCILYNRVEILDYLVDRNVLMYIPEHDKRLLESDAHDQDRAEISDILALEAFDSLEEDDILEFCSRDSVGFKYFQEFKKAFHRNT